MNPKRRKMAEKENAAAQAGASTFRVVGADPRNHSGAARKDSTAGSVEA